MTVWQDFQYGVRVLLKNRGTTFVAVLSLALGIGGTTAIFSVVNALMLRSLPYPDADRLVALFETPPDRPEGRTGAAIANYLEWREQTKSFEEIGAGSYGEPSNVGQGESGERIVLQQIQPTLLRALGISPILGRSLLPQDSEAGAEYVVLISHDLWQRQFGGDPDVIGKTLLLNSVSRPVIGVMPAGFWFANREVDVWLNNPLERWAIESRARWMLTPARLKPGVSIEQAQAEMDTVAARLAEAHPERNKGWGVRVEPIHEISVGQVRQPLLVLLGAVCFVLLIACVNVASLLIAQASSRQKEIAIRLAMGARRVRVIRQFLTESVLLSLAGGALGLLLAYWGVEVLSSARIANVPRLDEITLDGNVLLFALGVSLLTGILFGIAPAFQGSRPDLNESLKETGQAVTAGLIRHRSRSVLVVAEVALALILLIGAGLMTNSFLRLQGVDPGFNPEDLLSFQIDLPYMEYVKQVEAVRGRNIWSVSSELDVIYHEILERVARLPGVESAAAVAFLPAGRFFSGRGFRIASQAADLTDEELPGAGYYPVSPGFFRTMEIPVLRGRDFNEHDSRQASWVVIINRAMARRYWPDEDAVGQILKIEPDEAERAREVIGIVEDIHHGPLDREAEPTMYVPYQQQPALTRFANPRVHMSFIMRTSTEPMSLANTVRREVGEISREPIYALQTVEQHVSEGITDRRAYMALLAFFGGMAILLSAIGIYAVMAHSVTQRRREIGIRMALGAHKRGILRLVVQRGLLLTLIGVAIGLTGAFWLTDLITSQLYGVTATDPVTFVAVSLLLIGVALLACYLPARRAAKVDPMTALRYE